MTTTSTAAASTTHERELTESVQLCDDRGRLNPAAVGWSRHPLHTCNVSGHAPRKKRWNYWALNTDSFLFSATIADVDHYILAFVYYLDFATQRFIERTAILGPNSIALPEIVRADAVFEQGGRRVALLDEPDATRIQVECPDFGDVALSADLVVHREPNHETMNVVIPWSRERFQFTSKQNCLPVAGTIRLGDETMTLRDSDRAFACLDFGRGIWKYRTAWNWASCSTTLADGRPVGINVGGAWTDGTGMTENATFVDGRVTKIGEDARFEYDERDFMKPWRITTPSGAINLTFEPFYERVAKAKTGVLSSEVHQMFGRYTGHAIAADEVVPLDGVIGWIEQHKARW